MPDLVDRLYCSEQIHIPPTFPFIMKLYCKAAIRTQPYDLLKWSAAYFRALANGEEPPVKDRIEYPPYDSPTGLTPGYIKMLIKQLGKDPNATVSAQTLFIKWNCVCLEDGLLVRLLALMGAKTSVNWLKFVAVAAGFITSNLTNTMILICELLTDEPEGGMATIPLETFNELYGYLAEMECGPLSDEERKLLDEAESDEDVSAIAEKIRTAVYEEEEEEEGGAEAEEAAPEEAAPEEEIPGEDGFVLGSKLSDATAEKEPERKAEAPAKSEEKGAPGEEVEEEEEEEKGSEKEGEGEVEGDGDTEPRDEDSQEKQELGSKESVKDEEEGSQGAGDENGPASPGTQGSTSLENEELIKDEALADVKDAQSPADEEPRAADTGAEPAKPGDSTEPRKIRLEDIDERIRRKIEEKLSEDLLSEKSEEEGFEELGSYLLDAAARVRKYTAEEIGYRIFKKFLRQDVPGIGPRIDQAQVEKVVDFMDFHSNKQEGMVMPRNIRHWMCPPLDKAPLPEP